MELERLLGPKPGRRSISAVERQDSRSVESFGTGRRGTLVGAERALQTTPPFGQMAPQIPEAPHGSCQPQDKVDLAGGLEPLQSRSEVVVLALQPVEPLPRVAAQVRLRLLRECQEMLCVAPP